MPFFYTNRLAIPLKPFKKYGRRVLLVSNKELNHLRINEVVDGQLRKITVDRSYYTDLNDREFFLKEDCLDGELVFEFSNEKMNNAILAVRFGYLDVDQLFDDSNYVRIHLIFEKIFTMCWLDSSNKEIEN